MGARVYLPTLGRFTSRDMVQGGTANNYVYALDPINDSDYTGMWLHLSSVGKWIKQHAAAVVAVVIVVVIIVVAIYAPSALSTVARAAATISRSAVSAGTRIAGTIKSGGGSGGAPNSAGSVSRAATRVVNNSTELPSARVSQVNIDTKIAKQMPARGGGMRDEYNKP